MTQDHLTEGERRLVTVLFADLVGYTSASESADPELIQETLNLCFGRLGEEIRRHGGYVDKVIGDAIMALFGAPRAQEDDAGKAIAAGLAMQRAVEELVPEVEKRLGARFHLRVGINTGLVVTGAVGPGAYTVTGDAVNVASRLESNAPHGGVLVGETSRRLARRQFTWGERQELQVKNRVEPVVCYVAEGAGPALLRLVPSPSDTPYIGRDDLLARLSTLWHDASEERVVELVGEAGIGKTRFLAHFFAREGATADQVVYTRADTPPRTFGPLLQLLPSIAQNLPDALRTQIEALAQPHETEQPVFTPAEAHGSSHWLVDGLARIMTDLARRGPVALVLDDMHRADQATIEVVEKLLPRLASLPVLVLLLRQPLGRRPRRLPSVESMALHPLADEQAADLVRAAAPALDDQRVAAITARAGGNPLYLEVLAAAAARVPDGVAVPDSLQTAVVARIDDLDETSRTVLREACVFGHAFLEAPLKLLTETGDALYEALAHLCAVGLLDEQSVAAGRAYNFRHSLVQQVLLNGLLRGRRQALHTRAGEALEVVREEGIEIEPEQIAYHFEQAGDAQRAAAYHLASAERADRMRAPSEAKLHRRAASRALSLTSLADLYGSQRRPSLAGRASAALTQLILALVLVAPVFVLLATQRPRPDAITLGLPLDIVELNASSALIAIAIGGLPLLLAGILFTHLAAPSLMRRRVGLSSLALAVFSGWLLALAFVIAGFAAMVGLLRLGALDRLSSIYVGAATLQMLLGDYSLVLTALVGTLVVAITWALLLRLQAAGWMRQRRASIGPRQVVIGRRLAATRQLGMLLIAVGAASAAGLAAYEFGWLPNSDVQRGAGIVPLAAFGGVAATGGGVTLWAGRQLRQRAPDLRAGLFGFEVPLLCALAFGVVVWFGMRQAVIVSANNVDTPGDIAQFDRAVSLFPNLGLAYYLRGERHLAASDFAQPDDPEAMAARDDFSEAIERDPDFPASYLARGFILASSGDYEAALLDGERLIELRPNHPGGYAIRAMAHAGIGDFGAAADDLSTATLPLDEDARGWDAYFIRCIALVKANRLDEAKADCLQVLKTNPDQYVTLDQLVLIADEQEDPAAAIGYLDRMIAIDDTNFKTWANRGLFHRLLENYAQADADLSRALEFKPDDADSYQERAIARVFLDRGEEALADANAAVRLAPTERYTRLFVARYTGEDALVIEDATAILATLAGDSPNLPYVYSARGLARVESGDAAAGFADLDRALLDPVDQPGAFDRRGYARILIGDLVGAEADLDQALRGITLLPEQSRAELHYHRALLFQAADRFEAARAEIDEAQTHVEIPVVRRQLEELEAALPGN